MWPFGGKRSSLVPALNFKEGSMPIPPNHDHLTRRSTLLGAGASLLCAPAIVPVTNLMRLRGLILAMERPHEGFCRRLMFYSLYCQLRSGQQ
jgi:hypothetical protein